MIAPYAVVCRRDEEYATIFNAQKNGEAADNGLLCFIAHFTKAAQGHGLRFSTSLRVPFGVPFHLDLGTRGGSVLI